MQDPDAKELKMQGPGVQALKMQFPKICHFPSSETVEALPAKSLHKYLQWFDEFQKHRKSPVAGRPAAPEIMAFFVAQAKVKAPSTLWQAFGCLNSIAQSEWTLNLNKDKPLKRFIKNLAKKHVPKKSFTLSEVQVIQYLSVPGIGQRLEQQVETIFGIYGGLRPNELAQIDVDAAIEQPNGSLEVTLAFETKTEGGGHTFIIPSIKNAAFNPAGIVLTYVEQVQRDCGSLVGLLFRKEVNGKFTKRTRGKNTIAKTPCEIAQELKLAEPNRYTGAALRRSMATILSDKGISLLNLKRHGRWKSDAVAEGYIGKSKKTKNDVADLMLSSAPLSVPIAPASAAPASFPQQAQIINVYNIYQGAPFQG